MQEKLTKLWKTCETKQLAKIFKKYMDGLEVQKWDSRRKDNRNAYYAEGKSDNWNRVTCYQYKESGIYANENLSIVLRKTSGRLFNNWKTGKKSLRD